MKLSTLEPCACDKYARNGKFRLYARSLERLGMVLASPVVRLERAESTMFGKWRAILGHGEAKVGDFVVGRLGKLPCVPFSEHICVVEFIGKWARKMTVLARMATPREIRDMAVDGAMSGRTP